MQKNYKQKTDTSPFSAQGPIVTSELIQLLLSPKKKRKFFLWHKTSNCHVMQFLCVFWYTLLSNGMSRVLYVIFSWHLINPQDILCICIYLFIYFNAIQLRVVVQLKQIGETQNATKKSVVYICQQFILFAYENIQRLWKRGNNNYVI